MRTFTFGFDHTHPVTGESLARHYINVPGEDDLSRRFMLAVFGRNWAMQYKDPSKLKYLDRMTELKWSKELLALMSADDRDLFESVVGNRLEVEFGLEAPTKASSEVDEYFELQKQLPEVTTITGTPVTEYAQRMKSGAHHLLPDSEAFQTAYPIGKQVYHEMKFGGKVYVRRVLVVEDWREVTKEEADALVRQYTEHVVDLTPKDDRFGKSYDEYVAKQPPGVIELP